MSKQTIRGIYNRKDQERQENFLRSVRILYIPEQEFQKAYKLLTDLDFLDIKHALIIVPTSHCGCPIANGAKKDKTDTEAKVKTFANSEICIGNANVFSLKKILPHVIIHVCAQKNARLSQYIYKKQNIDFTKHMHIVDDNQIFMVADVFRTLFKVSNFFLKKIVYLFF
jgi:hypothetical protein